MADVVVAGSINVDVVASTPCHPRPGETVAGTDLRHFPGGKGANQAVAAARAGATVRMVGAVGDDSAGTDALRFLDDAGVDTRCVRTSDSLPTGTALIVVADNGENTIVVVPGANDAVGGQAVAGPEVAEGDVLVTQYEIPRQSTEAFLRHGRETGATCVLNPAPAAPTPPELLELVDILVVNESELAALSGTDLRPGASDAEIVGAVGQLRASGLSGLAVATLGSRGVLAVPDGDAIRVAGHPVNVVDTTGAGDCFVGALAAHLARSVPVDLALELANTAAALCVTQVGAGPSIPTLAQVNAFRHTLRRSG